jgi:hypothetical protein
MRNVWVWGGCFRLLGLWAYVDVGNIVYLWFLEMLFDFYFFCRAYRPLYLDPSRLVSLFVFGMLVGGGLLVLLFWHALFILVLCLLFQMWENVYFL